MPPAFETGEPTSAMELSHALGALLAAGTTYLSTLPDGAFFTPQGTAWSPAEHVRHLRKSTTSAVVGLQNATGRWPERVLDHHQLPHPLMGLLTVREMLAFTVYHTAHHLRQVAERAAA